MLHEEREPGQAGHGDGMSAAVSFPVAVLELLAGQVVEALADRLAAILGNRDGLGLGRRMHEPGGRGQQPAAAGEST